MRTKLTYAQPPVVNREIQRSNTGKMIIRFRSADYEGVKINATDRHRSIELSQHNQSDVHTLTITADGGTDQFRAISMVLSAQELEELEMAIFKHRMNQKTRKIMADAIEDTLKG